MVVAVPTTCSSANIGSSISGELGRLFVAFDADADGRISASELRECMRVTLGAEAAMSAEEDERRWWRRWTHADGDRLLDTAEFAGFVVRLHADASEEDRHRDLRQVFGLYSDPSTGEARSAASPAGGG